MTDQAPNVLHRYLRTCKRYMGRIILIVLIFIGLSVGVTLLMEKEYKASSQVIVTQDLAASSNIYSSRRAANAATETLIQVAYSDRFYNRFVEGNPDIQAFFPDSEAVEERRRAFERDVHIRRSEDGVIRITTYNPTKQLALKENKAALAALRATANEYFGPEDGVNVRTMNEPSLYEGIGRPNLWLNMVAGVVFGLVFSAVHMVFVTRGRIRRNQMAATRFVSPYVS